MAGSAEGWTGKGPFRAALTRRCGPLEIVAQGDRLDEAIWEQASLHAIHGISVLEGAASVFGLGGPSVTTDAPDPLLDAAVQAPDSTHVPIEAL